MKFTRSSRRTSRSAPTTTTHAVVFAAATKEYPGPHGSLRALDSLSLVVETREILTLLGPNGAGKTTTIELLVGLRRPSTGSVSTLGVDPARDRDLIRHRVSVQPQHAAVFEQQTVTEMLRCWSSFYPDAETADTMIERLGLESCRGQRIGKLSGGQQQRVLVALAMISKPDLLVLDEPSTGMDPNARSELWSAITDYRAAGGTVVLSTHSMEEAERLSDRVAILHHGRLAALGSPEALVAEHAPLREVTCRVPQGSDVESIRPLVDALVSTVDASGDTRLVLRTDDSDALLMALGSRVRARDIHLREAGLDGVFRAVTGRALDDDGDDADDGDPPEAGTRRAPSEPVGAGSRGEL